MSLITFSFKGADRRGMVTAMVAQGTLGFGKIPSPAHDQATYLLDGDRVERALCLTALRLVFFSYDTFGGWKSGS